MLSLSFLGKNGRARLTPVSRAQSRRPLIEFDDSSDGDAPEEDVGSLDFDFYDLDNLVEAASSTRTATSKSLK